MQDIGQLPDMLRFQEARRAQIDHFAYNGQSNFVSQRL